jgi:uncharacterized protein HemX
VTDWLEVATKVGVPLLGLIGGWVGATLRIQTKIGAIESAAAAKALEEAVYREQTKQGLIRDFTELRRTLAEQFDHLKEAFEQHTERIDQLRESRHDMAEKAALAQFIMESNDRWEQTVRTLGMLEGMLTTALPPARVIAQRPLRR